MAAQHAVAAHPTTGVGTRRLHDSNHSGRWQLMVMIPIAGWLVLLVFMLLPSDSGEKNTTTSGGAL